jgi:hypothetical protein
VPLKGIDIPASNAVDLEGALGSADESKCWYGYWGASNTELFASGTHVVAVAGYDERRIAVFDVSSGSPVLEGKLTIPALGGNGYYGYYGYWGQGPVLDAGSESIQVGSALLILRRLSTWQTGSQSYVYSAALDLVDLSDPKQPKRVSVPLPDALGATGLMASAGGAVMSHWAPSPTNPGKVRFYIDRIDVSKPSAPKLTSINVPGSLLGLDQTGKRALTVSYQKVVTTGSSPSECYQKWGYGAYWDWDQSGDYQSGTCTGFHRGLSLIQLGTVSASVLDTDTLSDGASVSHIAQGDDRVFLYDEASCWDCSNGPGTPQVIVASGLGAGKLTLASAAVSESAAYSYVSELLGAGTRAVAIGGYPANVTLIDAANPAAPVVTELAKDLGQGYDYYSGYGAAIIGDTLVLPRGVYGVKLVDLTP